MKAKTLTEEGWDMIIRRAEIHHSDGYSNLRGTWGLVLQAAKERDLYRLGWLLSCMGNEMSRRLDTAIREDLAKLLV